ncbi:uncharacterized protein ACO6RY_15768 [Pungitius sinensis]
MCLVDLEKAYDRVPREKMWEVLREYGVRGSLLGAIQSLYAQRESCVRVLGPSESSRWGLAFTKAAPYHQSCLWFSLTGYRGVAGGRRA